MLVEVGLPHAPRGGEAASRRRWYRRSSPSRSPAASRSTAAQAPAAAGGEGARERRSRRSTRTLDAREHARARARSAPAVRELPGAACASTSPRSSRRARAARAVNEAHSDVHDRLMRRLFESPRRASTPRRALDSAAGASPCRASAATRAARCRSRSDVDLLFLVEDAEAARSRSARSRASSTRCGTRTSSWARRSRTIDECIELGQRDETARTTLLGARFLAGEPRCSTSSARGARASCSPTSPPSSTASATRWRGGASASATRSICSSRT